MYPTSRKRLLRTAWRPWASISFCSKAVTIFATVPRSGCTTAVRRSSKSLPSTWLDKSLWILLLIREFGKIKIEKIHELFVILFDAYDIHIRIVNMILYIWCVTFVCKAKWVYLVGRTTTSNWTWPPGLWSVCSSYCKQYVALLVDSNPNAKYAHRLANFAFPLLLPWLDLSPTKELVKQSEDSQRPRLSFLWHCGSSVPLDGSGFLW